MRYTLKPIYQSGWAVVRRADNRVVNIMDSNPARRLA
jgi:hypothetical protein